jgi:hypothetical protein
VSFGDCQGSLGQQTENDASEGKLRLFDKSLICIIDDDEIRAIIKQFAGTFWESTRAWLVSDDFHVFFRAD